MTDQEKIEALARMEGTGLHEWSKPVGEQCIGFVPQCQNCCLLATESGAEDLCIAPTIPPYLTSHDALQPLLEKMTEEEWLRFGNLILGQTGFHNRWFHPKPILLMTPEQKADAILKTYGKWTE